MIRPEHNREAINILSRNYFFPRHNIIHPSTMARVCYALIQADRYLAKADKGRV